MYVQVLFPIFMLFPLYYMLALSATYRFVVPMLVCCLLLGAYTVSGQQPVFKCIRLTTADGLSDNMVFNGLQDRHGFMWFGTRDGLNRYDGYSFTVFRHNAKDSFSLINNAVTNLFEDSNGNLWVGTKGGIHKYNPTTERFTRYTDSLLLSGQSISSLCDDVQGNIWMTTSPPSSRLIKLNVQARKFIYYNYSSDDIYSLNWKIANEVCRDSIGNIWVITDMGLNRYDIRRDGFINGRNTPGYLYPALGAVEFFGANIGNYLWISDKTDRAFRVTYRDDTLTTRTYTPAAKGRILGNIVSGILPHQNNMFWIGTYGNGVYLLDTLMGRYIHFPQDQHSSYSIPGNRVFGLCKDRSGNVWFFTEGGIAKFHYQTRRFEHYNATTGLSSDNIRSIIKDKAGALWIGTAGKGIDSYKSGRARHYVPPDPYRKEIWRSTVNVLYQGRSHNLWAGSNEGLYTVTTSSNRYIPSLLKIQGWKIWSMLEDKQGYLWVGTLHNGVTRVNLQTKECTYFLQNKTSEREVGTSVFSLLESSGNILWMGTSAGLYRINTVANSWKHYYYSPGDTAGLGNNDIWYIHESSNGILWLGTSGGGFIRFDPKTETFRHFTERDGLPSNIICGILEDAHGNLWISSNKGLIRFTQATEKITTFDVGDGLYISEFHFKTCFKDIDGSMYFGGIGGYIHFHPDSIKANPAPPPMLFTGFKVFDQYLQFDSSMAAKKVVYLSHTNNFFTVEFAVLDYANSLKNEYRYKLEGVDEQWRQTNGTHPYASYTNVPAGEYTLWVQGSNSDGIWNNEGIRMAIVIHPAWWQTSWFKAVVALIAAGTIGFIAWWRYRNIRQRADVERRLVESKLQALRAQMNPHFIFNSLNSILHFIMSNEPEPAHAYLSKFSKLIRAILDQSRSEFISLSEELYVLGLYLELESLRFDGNFTYSIDVAENIDRERQQIPPMLLQPHVENAIKHGLIHTLPDGKLEIIMRQEGHYVVCSIIDNGIGRQRSQTMRGQSLYKHVSRGTSLIQDRLDILNNLHSEHYGVEFTDLTDSQGNARGTQVDIRIAATYLDE